MVATDTSARALGPKLVVLGGSSPNTPELFAALGAAGGSAFREVCLVGRQAENVERIGRLSTQVAEKLGLYVRITWETDLRTAARDATYVLNMLRVGGSRAELDDRRNLAASGIVGHAASYPEAMRHLSPTLAAAKTVQAVAPDAIFVNFTNPVSILCEAIAEKTALRCIGICHHAFSLQPDFAALLGVAAERVRVKYLGLNHLGWVTDVLVDGTSCFSTLLDRLIAGRVKAYDFSLVRDFNAIPIKHAAALYHKGEVLFVRQHGLRASLADTLVRYAGCAGLFDLLARRAERRGAEDRPHASWYARCIVPFLQTLLTGESREYILTWQHGGQVPEVPGRTAETNALVHAGAQVSAVPEESACLPAIATEWLRQVRASEHLLIRAVDENSTEALVEALAMHPSVASVHHARDFVRRGPQLD